MNRDTDLGKPLDDARLASSVFFPRPDQPFGPTIPAVRDHMVEVPDARIRIREFPGAKQAPVILFFHGNGETAADYDQAAADYAGLPAKLFVADYRGYGPSTGRPSLKALLADAHAALDEITRLAAADGGRVPIVVMGRSLGSAPAIELASSRSGDVAALVVESGFARIIPLLELLGVPARRLGVTEEHGPRNLQKMEKVSLPTLILHAENDTIIPIEDAEMLFNACRDSAKVFLRVPHAGHNDIQYRAGRQYFDAIRALLGRLGRTGVPLMPE